MSTDSVKMDTGIPLFFSEIQYLLLETIPLETIMRVNGKWSPYSVQIIEVIMFYTHSSLNTENSASKSDKALSSKSV